MFHSMWSYNTYVKYIIVECNEYKFPRIFYECKSHAEEEEENYAKDGKINFKNPWYKNSLASLINPWNRWY